MEKPKSFFEEFRSEIITGGIVGVCMFALVKFVIPKIIGKIEEKPVYEEEYS